jgi:uncharacterized membrane protein
MSAAPAFCGTSPTLAAWRRNQAARSRLMVQVGIRGDWGMGQIFCFALLQRRVRHDALRMRLRSHVRSAIKTASWRAFAAVDTFALVWLFSGHDATHAIAAAGAVVGVEAITKSFLYFAHERLWEAPAFSTRRVNGAHAHHFQSVEA